MALFDNVKEASAKAFEKAKEAGAKGLDKAKDLGEIGKYKVEIASAEAKKKDLFQEIGAKLCAEHEDVVLAHYGDLLARIKEYDAQIASLKEKIEDVKEN